MVFLWTDVQALRASVLDMDAPIIPRRVHLLHTGWKDKTAEADLGKDGSHCRCSQLFSEGLFAFVQAVDSQDISVTGSEALTGVPEHAHFPFSLKEPSGAHRRFRGVARHV